MIFPGLNNAIFGNSSGSSDYWPNDPGSLIRDRAAKLPVNTDVPGLIGSPIGNTWRGIFSSWFNSNNIAREDWLRDQQASNNSYLRSLALQENAQNFSEYMAKHGYQFAVEDMKKAGLNPILAYSQGASSGSSPSASSSGSGYSPKNNQDPGMQILMMILSIFTKGLSGAIDSALNPNMAYKSTKIGFTRDY